MPFASFPSWTGVCCTRGWPRPVSGSRGRRPGPRAGQEGDDPGPGWDGKQVTRVPGGTGAGDPGPRQERRGWAGGACGWRVGSCRGVLVLGFAFRCRSLYFGCFSLAESVVERLVTREGAGNPPGRELPFSPPGLGAGFILGNRRSPFQSGQFLEGQEETAAGGPPGRRGGGPVQGPVCGLSSRHLPAHVGRDPEGSRL